MTAPATLSNRNTNCPTDAYLMLAAGTYDLVALDPSGAKRCATRIVCLAADAGWVLTRFDGTVLPSTAVPVTFAHIGHTQAITCASPIAVYY